MKALARYIWIRLLILPLCVSVAFAQTDAPAPQEHIYTQAELDQILAPIALYPDPLLSQILMAATYPLEVVEAARWSQAHPGLRGDDAVRAVEGQDWDPSVKSLVAFPQILAMMDAKLAWTETLGDAFLAQQEQVMDSIQSLRRRAYDVGNLESNDEVNVEYEDDSIAIEPVNPDVIYVPYYNPVVVYGTWWWPAYPPVYWAPWPGYFVRSGFVGIAWGIGINVGVNFFFGTWDWSHHHVRIVDRHPFYYRRLDRRPLPPDRIWRHNPEHRRGVPYRSPAVRERFRHTYGSPERRREFRGFLPRTPEVRIQPRERTAPRVAPGGNHRPPEATVPRGSRPPQVRPPQERSRVSPPGGTERLRPNTPVIRRLPSQPSVRAPSVRPAPESRPHVFEGVGRGRDVRRYSERGRASAGAHPPTTNRPSVRQQPAQRQRSWQPPAQAPAPPDGSGDSNRWYPRRR